MLKRVNTTQRYNKIYVQLASVCLLASSLLLTPNAALAKEEDKKWWFNVEFIAFKRDLLPSNIEDFSHSKVSFSSQEGIDILAFPALKTLYPLSRYTQKLPVCRSDVFSTDSKDINTSLLDNEFSKLNSYIDKVNRRHFEFAYWDYRINCISEAENNAIYSLSTIPKSQFANRELLSDRPHLIEASSLALEDYAKRVFSQRDIKPLLHTAWRQEVVFGLENADYIKIRAGERLTIPSPTHNKNGINLSQDIFEDASAKNANEDFFKNLENALERKRNVDWLSLQRANQQVPIDNYKKQSQWELDGLFKVYLDYVGQVPYLHIETEFKHHKIQLNSDGIAEIQMYPFKQRRRIISKQIHYFDHPAFGIIVRLERYEPPTQPQS